MIQMMCYSQAHAKGICASGAVLGVAGEPRGMANKRPRVGPVGVTGIGLLSAALDGTGSLCIDGDAWLCGVARYCARRVAAVGESRGARARDGVRIPLYGVCAKKCVGVGSHSACAMGVKWRLGVPTSCSEGGGEGVRHNARPPSSEDAETCAGDASPYARINGTSSKLRWGLGASDSVEERSRAWACKPVWYAALLVARGCAMAVRCS